MFATSYNKNVWWHVQGTIIININNERLDKYKNISSPEIHEQY